MYSMAKCLNIHMNKNYYLSLGGGREEKEKWREAKKNLEKPTERGKAKGEQITGSRK